MVSNWPSLKTTKKTKMNREISRRISTQNFSDARVDMSSRDLGFNLHQKSWTQCLIRSNWETRVSPTSPSMERCTTCWQPCVNIFSSGPVKVKSVVNRHIWDDRYLVLTATSLTVFAAQSHYDEVCFSQILLSSISSSFFFFSFFISTEQVDGEQYRDSERAGAEGQLSRREIQRVWFFLLLLFFWKFYDPRNENSLFFSGEARVSITMSDRKQTLECITSSAAEAQTLIACCLGVVQVVKVQAGERAFPPCFLCQISLSFACFLWMWLNRIVAGAPTQRSKQKDAFRLVKDVYREKEEKRGSLSIFLSSPSPLLNSCVCHHNKQQIDIYS